MTVDSDKDGLKGATEFRGIFMPDGSRLTIPKITLSITPEGVAGSDVDVLLSLDQWPFWLKLGVQHARAAIAHHQEVLLAWEEEVEGERRGIAMEREFESAMQAIAAAGIAIDAFYASVKEFVTLPADLTARWHTNGTARYKQIAEVYRRAFALTPRNSVRLRDAVKEIFRYRDWAVHPPAIAAKPVKYDELRIGTEWRLVAFRAHNARGLAGRALAIIAQLVDLPRELNPQFVRYCEEGRQRIMPLLLDWEAENGLLFERREGSRYVLSNPASTSGELRQS